MRYLWLPKPMSDTLTDPTDRSDTGAKSPAMSDAAHTAVVSASAGHARFAPLYWSRVGEVACGIHAPAPSSPRWACERWAEMPSTARRRHGVEYQCQHCSASGRPIGRPSLGECTVTFDPSEPASEIRPPHRQ